MSVCWEMLNMLGSAAKMSSALLMLPSARRSNCAACAGTRPVRSRSRVTACGSTRLAAAADMDIVFHGFLFPTHASSQFLSLSDCEPKGAPSL